ncbi:MAG: hypothetical protein B7Z55_02940 [Planctomycetales bacterium 12-60-4]|nr:MAG: hypothetical protein B7Z55_02940 [Planctomycetales bacterium 12-60-4]
MRVSKVTLLKFAALACFVAAYRFVAHGVTLRDSASLLVGCGSLLLGVILTASASYAERRRA